jgi:aminomethyltransferase
MCYQDGGVVDDLIIYQVGDEEYLLCINAANVEKDVEWITGQAVGIDCLVDNVTDTFGQLALQGPLAMKILNAASGQDFSSLKRFHFIQGACLDTQALISRTGYTGEDGIEIYLPAGEAARVANRLLETGKDHGMVLAGLGARNSLRLEAGYPLYGHEISTSISPLAGGLNWVVKFNKPVRFVGQDALETEARTGPERKVVYFRLQDRRIAREGTEIVDAEGNPVGKVLSGTQSPMLGKPIGSALVEASLAQIGADLFVDIRGKRLPIEVARPPLHQSAD